jgi:hypothetical protein
MSMTKTEAKRFAYRWVLGILTNFGDSWVHEWHLLPPDDQPQCAEAMRALQDMLTQGAFRPQAKRRRHRRVKA